MKCFLEPHFISYFRLNIYLNLIEIISEKEQNNISSSRRFKKREIPPKSSLFYLGLTWKLSGYRKYRDTSVFFIDALCPPLIVIEK